MMKDERANSMAIAVEELSMLVAKYEGRVYPPQVQLIHVKFRSLLSNLKRTRREKAMRCS